MSNLKIDIDFDIQDDLWEEHITKIREVSDRIAREVFEHTGLSNYAKVIEFSIILTNDDYIQQLNNDYRGYNKPTNVLSFPAEELDPNDLAKTPVLNGFLMIGDIVFSYKTLVNEANNQGKTLESHYFHLLVHGLLHLLGFDHQSEEDANVMERIEIDILSKFKIDSPYT